MRKTSIIFVSALVAALAAGSVFAHCDTANGPVIPEAKAALAAGDATPILKWVMPADEEAVKTPVANAVAFRTQSPEAQELADQYFLETLVRLHRAGEGAPYTGIKDEPVEPIVALADGALAAGSADEMIGKITGHVGQAVREKFDRALQARKHKDDSVEAGREYVAAYVAYVHFVEGVHAAVMSAGSHAHAPATAIHEAHAE